MSREERERTPFGERLYAARKHAKLTQPQLAKAAGMAQSTLGELEWIGDGSSKTAQLAAACGVRAEWLATGNGLMVDEEKRLHPEVAEMAKHINDLPKKKRDLVLLAIRNSVTLVNEAGVIGQDQEDEDADDPQPAVRRVG